jgi:hypothetical protein
MTGSRLMWWAFISRAAAAIGASGWMVIAGEVINPPTFRASA